MKFYHQTIVLTLTQGYTFQKYLKITQGYTFQKYLKNVSSYRNLILMQGICFDVIGLNGFPFLRNK